MNNVNYGIITEEVVKNYEKWINHSKLTEDEFLLFSSNRLNIKKIVLDDLFLIQLISIDNDNLESVIGEPFIIKNNDKELAIDLALLLLYIAQRLDEKNNNADEYFFSLIKEFIKEDIEISIGF